jgi:hypothetical protein
MRVWVLRVMDMGRSVRPPGLPVVSVQPAPV